MFIKKFFIEACKEYDPFYCMPRLCDEIPTEGDCIQVNFINADASELFALGDGKYRIKGTEITFKDPRNVMPGMSDGFVHLVLTTYYDRVKMDYEDFIPETEAIHAGVVDRDHESVFKAFVYEKNQIIASNGVLIRNQKK